MNSCGKVTVPDRQPLPSPKPLQHNFRIVNFKALSRKEGQQLLILLDCSVTNTCFPSVLFIIRRNDELFITAGMIFHGGPEFYLALYH